MTFPGTHKFWNDSAAMGCNELAQSKMLDKGKTGAEIERKEENQFTRELKLSDKLAIERTVLAADRTMLAGVRTSIAFIGFGFTIFNLLKYFQNNASMKLMRPHTPRNFGAFMLAVGTIPLLVMIIQYSRTLRRMGRKETVFSNPNLQMAVAVFLLGFILLVTIIADNFLL